MKLDFSNSDWRRARPVSRKTALWSCNYCLTHTVWPWQHSMWCHLPWEMRPHIICKRRFDVLPPVFRFRFRSRSINKFHRQKAFVYTKFSSDNNVSCMPCIVVCKRYSLTFTFTQNESQIECDSASSAEMGIILLLPNANYYILSVYADTEITVLFYVNPIISLVARARLCVCVCVRALATNPPRSSAPSSQFPFCAIQHECNHRIGTRPRIYATSSGFSWRCNNIII